ncbi:DinB family protein [Corticicoccus populi]|uniref:DinB family protein n=1 Tax=Corticicoccus populi TaxID=1812821 RepID=A0ABW5WXD7_9STAP
MTKELLHSQLKSVRNWVLKAYEDTDQSLIDIVPAGFNNNLHWQFGHVADNIEGELVRLLEKDDSDQKRLKKYFGYGTSPDQFDDETPSFEEIKEILDRQVDEYGEVPEERLEGELDEAVLGNSRSDTLSAFIIAHEALHAGKIQEIKRLLEETY